VAARLSPAVAIGGWAKNLIFRLGIFALNLVRNGIQIAFPAAKRTPFGVDKLERSGVYLLTY
jgi:hypothetical protein